MLCVAGCRSNRVITYSGDTLPLEQVAVLTPTAEAGHILSVDGENHINQRSVGTEFHLLSRNHTVAIFYRDQSSSIRNIWVIKETTLATLLKPVMSIRYRQTKKHFQMLRGQR